MEPPAHSTVLPTRALEESAQEFAARYGEYATEGVVHPSPEGSPLIEFSASGRVFYLFDRNGLYEVSSGPCRLLIHAMLDESRIRLGPSVPNHEQIHSVGISSLEGCGKIVAIRGRHWVVQARVLLLLCAFAELPSAKVGDWVSFATLPPTHGFLVSG